VARTRVLLSALLFLLPLSDLAAQGLAGALIGTVRDSQGLAISGAEVRVGSPALIGGPIRQATNDKGQLRFPALPPGAYTLDIEAPGFATHHEQGIVIGAGATLERSVVLTPAGVVESIDVDGGNSRIDARDPGFGTRFGPEFLRAIPTRRSSMFDALRNVPGVSPTSPSGGTVTTISAFGSGTNENQFLIDGTNMTCPCNGVARAEPGVDFIQEVQVQSVGASAEYGNVQGAVINVITRQGGERFAYDASYYGQPHNLTSQPVRLKYDSGRRESGYERARYRDFTSNLGGPAISQRLWFFAGYQYLRDYDSQPGTDPALPKTYEQNKVFAKLTWSLAPNWQLNQSLHEEYWVSPDQPRFDRPIPATTRATAHVPAMTFGDLTHTMSARTVWDVRAGRFTYDMNAPPTTGDTTVASHLDAVTNVLSFAPPSFSGLYLSRTVVKGVITHYRSGLWGADHAFKAGAQVERGEHHTYVVIPTGVRYTDRNGPLSATYSDPSNTGAMFITTGLFATDQITIGDRLTVNAGLRFDRSRAISQDLPRLDPAGNETDVIVPGLGTMFTWNIVSPRLGVTMKLDSAGHTMLRASYGRFAQGVLTGEIGSFHPGATALITKAWVAADGDYTKVTQFSDRNSLVLDPGLRAPRTDEYGIGIDREIGSRLQIAAAYVRKSGADFIGWQDIGGIYDPKVRPLADGSTIAVYDRRNAAADQRFFLTNPADYSMTYNGLVTAVEKRRAHGWQAFGSYTYSRASGLQPGSGGLASAAQVSTVAPPPVPAGLTFGRDPNDLTNARGILPNDRPHMLRATGSVDVPGTGIVVAANLQYFTGKPWAATTQVALQQSTNQRILIEPRGSRRLSSQTLLDLRLSRPIAIAPGRRVELLLDVLNALNESAEESIVSDTRVTETIKLNPTFGQPNAFVDPRRVMLGVRVNLGKS
jgi:TonB dependent receptor/Carboxypeptidase regulatory-like domain/TonB-dependent Receptor Plug Domain